MKALIIIAAILLLASLVVLKYLRDVDQVGREIDKEK